MSRQSASASRRCRRAARSAPGRPPGRSAPRRCRPPRRCASIRPQGRRAPRAPRVFAESCWRPGRERPRQHDGEGRMRHDGVEVEVRLGVAQGIDPDQQRRRDGCEPSPEAARRPTAPSPLSPARRQGRSRTASAPHFSAARSLASSSPGDEEQRAHRVRPRRSRARAGA